MVTINMSKGEIMEKIQLIKELRRRTNVSLSQCKRVLIQKNYDIEEAIIGLQKLGEVNKAKRAQKETNAGRLQCYLHHDGRIAVLVEVNCETDISARTNEFCEFCENLTLQVASEDPEYLSVNDIPDKVIAKQREIFAAQVPKDVPKNKVAHIINGKLKKWFGQVCLVDQKSIIIDKKTVEQMRSDLVQQLDENVIIKRFVRWELGDE